MIQNYIIVPLCGCTKQEITYAEKTGKKVNYLEE